RRELLIAFAAGAVPFVCLGQTQLRTFRVGILYPDTVTSGAHLIESFVRELAKFGYVEGKNTSIERHFTEGNSRRLPVLVAVLLSIDPAAEAQLAEIRRAAKTLGIAVATGQVGRREDFDPTLALMAKLGTDSLLVVETAENFHNRKVLADFAMQARRPAMFAS